MTVLLHAFGTLCALAAAVFATSAADRAGGIVALPLGFLSTALWIATQGAPPAAPIGAATAGVAWLVLLRPGWRLLAAAAAGSLSALWIHFLSGRGLDLLPATLLAVGVVGFSALATARRPDFAPAGIREEALLVVGGLGLIVAVGPQLVAGWSSAAALNATPGAIKAPGPEAWVLLVVVGALALGGALALRRSR